MKTGAIAGVAVATVVCVVAVPFAVVVLFALALANTGSSCGPAAPTADGSPTILGPATLTASQIAAWWQASGHGQATPVGVDIATLAGWYIDHGRAEGVRGDYAFAQAVEETTQAGTPFNSPAAHRFNFAGIGITGSGAHGYDFPDAQTGVVAQLQLLKEVAAGNGAALAEARVAPTWGGRPATTWAGLAGNWAAATDYWDPNIKAIYASMGRGAPQTGITGSSLVSAHTSCAPGAGVPVAAGLPVSGNLGPLWAFLRAQLGRPYRWGGTGPDAWDCSGLMQAGWAQVGVNLPRVSAEQYLYTRGATVALSAIQPGDLVFWGPSAQGIHHVAIYVGNGQVLDALKTGTNVQIQAIWTRDLFAVTRPAGGLAPSPVLAPR